MNFHIRPLEPEQFSELFNLDDAALKARGAVKMVADEKPGFPCRVSLQDAEIGETVILLNYEHLPMKSPYRSKAAIFVRKDVEPAKLQTNEIPDGFKQRIVAARAFNKNGMMVDADIAEGESQKAMIERLLGLPDVDFIHLHWAKHGCYAARVDRAQ